MFQPDKSTQNMTEREHSQDVFAPQIKGIDKLESSLQQILAQQQTNQSNLQVLGDMLFMANQKLSLLLPVPQPN